ncbi:MAG: hypothetical protein M1821_007817 [Bathelium mastoideum]|nr:MAG: hypothetical protein M1821_007817 [Bathelium mastoideum]KAI9688586.1 MAG: hypothetical protein M1822_001535 [Bathelium mastoideum]
MSDSPAVRLPLDPKEQPILDRILDIRDRLSLLKADKSTYVKTQDVLTLYTQINEQVEILNEIRKEKRDEQNKVDTVLDDCYQLISLFFMTVGRTQEAPAVYSAVSTVKRLLDHLREAGFYSRKDLISIGKKLEEWQDSVERGKEHHSPHLLTLLEARMAVCRTILDQLEHELSHLTPELEPVYEELVSILRSLSGCNSRSKFPISDVKQFHSRLLEIAAQTQDTLTTPIPEKDERSAEDRYADKLRQLQAEHDAAGNVAPEGRKVVSDLLARCLIWADVVEQKQGKIDDPFRDTYEKLRDIRNQLDRLTLTQSWSLRETDLWGYQRQLDRIDEARVDGNFLDAEGRPADMHAQRMLLYLLRKSYAFIYQLIIASEPVSEALLPIYNQLTTLRRCLWEVKNSGGVDSPRELYPYSMKLSSIDNMRVDGKFMISSEIPEGQNSVSALLSECFDLAKGLRVEAEERQEKATPKVTDASKEDASAQPVGIGVQ